MPPRESAAAQLITGVGVADLVDGVGELLPRATGDPHGETVAGDFRKLVPFVLMRALSAYPAELDRYLRHLAPEKA